jgi:hypothetical protein
LTIASVRDGGRSGSRRVRVASRIERSPQIGSTAWVSGRLTTTQRGEHHITVPDHGPLRVGPLAGILADVAAHFEMSRDDLMMKLFGGD